MRKLLFVFLILLFSTVLLGQNSAVTATITDSDGQTWNNGTFTITFVPIQGVASYQWNGGVLDQAHMTFTGTMNGFGILAKTIPDSSTISPSGTQWRFTLCSNTSAPCSNITLPVSGGTPNLSSVLSAGVKAPRINSGQGAFAYADVEVNTPSTAGLTYYSVTLALLRIWSGSSWSSISVGGSGTVGNGQQLQEPGYAANGTTIVPVSKNEVYSALYGVMANDTDMCSVLNDPITGLLHKMDPANGGQGGHLVLPIGGPTKISSCDLKVPVGIIIDGNGAAGWNSTPITLPSSYLHAVNTGSAAHVMFLGGGGQSGAKNLTVVDDVTNTPCFLYTASVPYLDNVTCWGRHDATMGQTPDNIGLIMGNDSASAAVNDPTAGFSGYGASHIYGLFCHDVSTCIKIGAQSSGWEIHDVRGDFSDKDLSHGFVYGDSTHGTSYAHKITGLKMEQAPYNVFTTCNYPNGAIVLNRGMVQNTYEYDASDTGNCTKSASVLDTAGSSMWNNTTASGYFSGQFWTDASSNYLNNTWHDLPNEIMWSRGMNAVNYGLLSQPSNFTYYAFTGGPKWAGSSTQDSSLTRTALHTLTLNGASDGDHNGNLILNNLTVDGTCTGCGAGSGVTSINGTVNQIDVTNPTTTAVASLDAAIHLPGSIQFGTTTTSVINGCGGYSDIWIAHKNGTCTNYPAASNTNASRGAELVIACGACVDGDTINLSAQTFDFGTTLSTNTCDLSVVRTGSCNLNGISAAATIVERGLANGGTAIISPPVNGVISNLTVMSYITPGIGVVDPPIWNIVGGTYYDTNLTTRNVTCNAISDCYVINPVTSSVVYEDNATNSTNWDATTDTSLTTGTIDWTMENTTTTCTPDSSNKLCTCYKFNEGSGSAKLKFRGTNTCLITSSISGAAVRGMQIQSSFPTIVDASPGAVTINTSGVTSATTDYDIDNNTGNTIHLSPGSKFDSTKVHNLGTIDFTDSAAAIGTVADSLSGLTGVLLGSGLTPFTAIAAVGTKCYPYQGSGGTGCDTPSGSGGDNITTPNSTLVVGGTSSNTTLDLAGATGEIMAGATPALTRTPSLGDSTHLGTLTVWNPAGSGASTTWASGATTSNTVKGFAASPTTNDIIYCVVTSTTCTMTDAGYPFNAIPLVDLAAQTANTIVMNGTSGSAAPTAVAIPNPCGDATHTCAYASGVFTQTAITGGSGDTITSPNSTLTIGGTSTNTTLDLTGAAGEIMAGATPALTRTPSLGDATHSGTLTLFNASFGASATIGTNASSSYTVKYFSALPASNDLFYCVIASTTCTFTDTGYTYNAIPLVDLAPQAANTIVMNGTSGSAAPTAVAIPSPCGDATHTCAYSAGVFTQTAITATTVTIFSGTLTLATSSISSGTCQAVSAGSVNSVTASGVAATDAVIATPNASWKAITGFIPGTSGGLTVNAYPTSGFINVDVCNWTSSSITPGSGATLNLRVVR